MVKAAGVSDEPELEAAIEELLADERGRAPQSAAELSPTAVPAPVEKLPQAVLSPELDESAKAPQRAGGWRGLFSRKERRAASATTAEQHTVEPAWEDQAMQPAEEPEPISPPEHEGLASPAVHADAIPRTGDDWFDRALSGLDEVAEPYERSGRSTAHDRSDEEDIAQSDLEAHPPAAEEQPSSSAPPAEPAVIGRYTSGNTTY